MCILLLLQPLRIFNTWMGDQSKLVLLKEVVKVIQEEGLLQRVQEAGRVLLSGLENIQVSNCVQEIRAFFFFWFTNEALHALVAVLHHETYRPEKKNANIRLFQADDGTQHIL